MVRALPERVSLTCSVSFAQKDLENNRGQRYLSVRLALGVGIVFMALLGLCGCGSNSGPVEVQPQSGLERAKGILNDYASGAPLGSEGAMYEEIVVEVRQTDPQKATILENGFADLKRSPQNLRGKARALLNQL